MHNNQCPYPSEKPVKVLCNDCIHHIKCKDVNRGRLTYCGWYESKEMFRTRKRQDAYLISLANSVEYASTMIDVVNQVIFGEKFDKGDPKDSRKSRIQSSLGERDGVMKTLKAIMRVLELDDKDYVNLIIYLNKVKESKNVRSN